MQRRMRTRFWITSASAVISCLMLIATLINGDWIETAFGFDPDAGSRITEWLFVAALAGVAMIGTVLARRDWRNAASAS
jgi:hypothetical protein